MSRFARVTGEMLMRHKELAVEHHKTGKLGKSALETLYLYVCILCHSWATGILEMPLKDLCKLYELEYHNSTRRLKTLRQKGWVEDTKKYIRPLLLHRPGDKNLFPAGDSKSVIITPANAGKSVTVTPEKCNGYTEIKEKSVTVTPENGGTSIPLSDYDDSKTLLDLKTDFMDTTHGENAAGVSVKNKNNLSKFSLEECLTYALECRSNGDDIRNPRALAVSLHKSGIADAFIEARLYPNRHAPKPDTRFNERGEFVPQPLTDRQRDYYLENLASFSDEEFDENEWRGHFTPDDWAWLKGELQNAG